MGMIQLWLNEYGRKMVGTTIATMLETVPSLTVRRICQILYLLEEDMVLKEQEPFLGLSFQIWKEGPMPVDIFADLSGEPVLTAGIVVRNHSLLRRGELTVTDAKRGPMAEGMKEFIRKETRQYAALGEKEMKDRLCGEKSLWRKCAEYEGLLEAFERNEIVTSGAYIDFTMLFDPDDEDTIDDFLIAQSHICGLMENDVYSEKEE